jgi:hypothetical protein
MLYAYLLPTFLAPYSIYLAQCANDRRIYFQHNLLMGKSVCGLLVYMEQRCGFFFVHQKRRIFVLT